MYPLRNKTLALLLAGLMAGPVSAENPDELKTALAASQRRDWAAALVAAERSGPIATDIVTWQKLRAGQGIFSDYLRFADKHADWPGMELLYRRGEAALTPSTPPDQVLRWFGERAPETATGANALIAALRASGQDDKAQSAIRRAWATLAMSPEDEKAFLDGHRNDLEDQHDGRVIALLDKGEWQAARHMLDYQPPIVSPKVTQLAFARIKLQSGAAGVDDLILALPADSRDDAGLAVDRFSWRVKAKMGDLARALMLERSTSANALRDPKAWAGMRMDYARQALRGSDWALAYDLAKAHFLSPDNPDYADLEWLAGYAALRAGQPETALAHFDHLETVVGTPISLSRAAYWQARACEAMGDAEKARTAYRKGAGFQSAYYGQLSAEKLGQTLDPALALAGRGVTTLPDWRDSDIRRSEVWQAAVWLFRAGDIDLSRRFLLHLAETSSAEDIARMARMAREWRQPHIALRLAKMATRQGAILTAAYFPLTGLEETDLGVPPELAMAIARRESEFDPAVMSHAGARGLMQLMPGTARMMAAELGEPYQLGRLTTDAAYNARLGSAYLAGLRQRFGPSIALVAAGYNAGPGRSARWLDDFGDLRVDADPVDWVEMIPFDETRNYVMRVAEALPIYRARIKGEPVAVTPTEDLRGSGIVPQPPELQRTVPVLSRSARPVPAPAKE